jgi:hypothetical protein
MRFVGLTLALLASSLGARADSVEDRVNALEARVKALEEALRAVQGIKQPAAANIDGEYKGTLPEGAPITLTFDKGKVVATTGNESKTGTYEIVGQRVLITAEGGKSETLTIDGNVLHANAGKDKTIDFTKTK